jgi:hypothetical protein
VSRSVDLTSNGMGNHYLRDVNHGSTLLNTSHRKAMNSNVNQVYRVFSRTQWECICSSVMKLADLILHQSSHSPLTIDTETLGLSITGEKYTVASM